MEMIGNVIAQKAGLDRNVINMIVMKIIAKIKVKTFFNKVFVTQPTHLIEFVLVQKILMEKTAKLRYVKITHAIHMVYSLYNLKVFANLLLKKLIVHAIMDMPLHTVLIKHVTLLLDAIMVLNLNNRFM